MASITCPKCGMTSHNPNDVHSRYCGNCHEFHENLRPTDTWVRAVCKVGQGHACCRYLTMAPDGWSCEKLTPTGRYLDSRVEAGTITARGDNCAGLASSTPNAKFDGTLEDMLRGVTTNAESNEPNGADDS